MSCLITSFAGVDYNHWEYESVSLDVEFHAGDLEEEEYIQRCWLEVDLHPEGGRVAEPKTEGSWICRPCAGPLCHNPCGLGCWRVMTPDWLM